MHATVWDFPGWRSPLTVSGMKDRPGAVGYFPLTQSGALVCDNDGKLYIEPGQRLTPSRDSHPQFTVQVSWCEDGLAVHVPVPARNNIYVSSAAPAYLPIAKVLKEPLR